MQYKQEELNQPDSRVFLRNPRWPRDDVYASITNFRDNQVDQEVSLHTTLVCTQPYLIKKSSLDNCFYHLVFNQVKVAKLHEEVIKAQEKANDLSVKMEIVQFFKSNYNCK